MGKKDSKVDAYIDGSPDFAKPVLKHLRKLVHNTCPGVEETIKWQKPTFLYKGMLCGMAAFKNHCAMGFWKYALIDFEKLAGSGKTGEAMGQLGRITSLSDLPSDRVLTGYVREAMRLNEQGAKVPKPVKPPKKPLPIPADLAAALKKNKKALATFENFSPSRKREYLEWIIEAKREETRVKRLETTIEWLSEGKPRNWKYANC